MEIYEVKLLNGKVYTDEQTEKTYCNNHVGSSWLASSNLWCS
jgi:hypothetical protein